MAKDNRYMVEKSADALNGGWRILDTRPPPTPPRQVGWCKRKKDAERTAADRNRNDEPRRRLAEIVLGFDPGPQAEPGPVGSPGWFVRWRPPNEGLFVFRSEEKARAFMAKNGGPERFLFYPSAGVDGQDKGKP
jgi:hypothetical protein